MRPLDQFIEVDVQLGPSEGRRLVNISDIVMVLPQDGGRVRIHIRDLSTHELTRAWTYERLRDALVPQAPTPAPEAPGAASAPPATKAAPAALGAKTRRKR